MDLRNRAWATYYASRGYNPIPSVGKRPARGVYPSDYWETPVPRSWLSQHRWEAIQLMTGVRWGLVVLDMDGPVREAWETLRAGRPFPRTWVVRSGGGGWHAWFRPPADATSFASRRLWGIPRPDGRGWEKGSCVEFLGDRRLITAPESCHKSGGRYRWVVGPHDLPQPAVMPDWLARLPRAELPPRLEPRPRERISVFQAAPGRGHYPWRQVLDAIPDPGAVAESWGLRFASPSYGPSGWRPCYSALREDRTPSASFSRWGWYWETDLPGRGSSKGLWTLFDLGVQLGRYADWRDACDHLGTLYCPAQTRRA